MAGTSKLATQGHYASSVAIGCPAGCQRVLLPEFQFTGVLSSHTLYKTSSEHPLWRKRAAARGSTVETAAARSSSGGISASATALSDAKRPSMPSGGEKLVDREV